MEFNCIITESSPEFVLFVSLSPILLFVGIKPFSGQAAPFELTLF